MEQKKISTPYSPEFRDRTVRLFMEHRGEYRSESSAHIAIAGKLGCSADSLRAWCQQAQHDGGERPGPSSAQRRPG